MHRWYKVSASCDPTLLAFRKAYINVQSSYSSYFCHYDLNGWTIWIALMMEIITKIALSNLNGIFYNASISSSLDVKFVLVYHRWKKPCGLAMQTFTDTDDHFQLEYQDSPSSLLSEDDRWLPQYGHCCSRPLTCMYTCHRLFHHLSPININMTKVCPFVQTCRVMKRIYILLFHFKHASQPLPPPHRGCLFTSLKKRFIQWHVQISR